jgi:hypothetical protein
MHDGDILIHQSQVALYMLHDLVLNFAFYTRNGFVRVFWFSE